MENKEIEIRDAFFKGWHAGWNDNAKKYHNTPDAAFEREYGTSPPSPAAEGKEEDRVGQVEPDSRIGSYEGMPHRADFERLVWAQWEKDGKPKVNMHGYLQGAIAGYKIRRDNPPTPPAGAEGEREMPAQLPPDLLMWVRVAEYVYSHQKSDQDAYRAGATDMYWELLKELSNPKAKIKELETSSPKAEGEELGVVGEDGKINTGSIKIYCRQLVY